MSNIKGEAEWAVIVVIAVIGLAIYGGTSLWQESSLFGSKLPHSLKADGELYISCKGRPTVKKEGSIFASSDTFEVSFVDASGLTHTLNGVRKVETSELPAIVDAPMPYPLPPAQGSDKSGTPLKEGNIYTWSDGAKARFKNQSWAAVKVPNTVCTVP